MTSKEMEARSGLPRANIRYYETEGLLHPTRAKNGYRDYQESDLVALEKIKLLRRLGISIEDLKRLQCGQLELSDAMALRLQALETEQETLVRVEEVCGDLRTSGASFETLNAEKYLQALDAVRIPPAIPKTDVLPTVNSPFRRLFARLFDYYLIFFIGAIFLMLMGYHPANISSGIMGIGVILGMLVVEPLLLHLFGTTPGKALLGMRLSKADGQRLSYGEGATRLCMLAWHGLGLWIPIWSLIQLYRTFNRCMEEEPQPWDADIAYTARPFKMKMVAAFVLAVALLLGVTEGVNSARQRPPNRGDLTVAEFVENFNYLARYYGIEFSETLDEQGQWQKEPRRQNGNVVMMNLADDWEAANDFYYTVEDGRLTAITLAASKENVEAFISLPSDTMLVAVMAFTWAQPESPFLVNQRNGAIQAIGAAGFEGFSLHETGTDITLDVEMTGFHFMQNDWLLLAQEGKSNEVSFTFRISLAE